jgi:transaldolase
MDPNSYFTRVLERTSTQFWINSAIQTDLEYALAAGAVSNTTNPTHPPRAIRAEREKWEPVIDEMLKTNPEMTNDKIADELTQQMAVQRLQMFHPLYEKSGGKYGYVAIQGNPFTNDDLEKVLLEAKTYSELGENICVKVQSTVVGAKAVEELTALGINTICTNGFSTAQAIHMAEAYEKGLKRTNSKPRCFIVNISGVFEEYLGEVANAQEFNVSTECLLHAGSIMIRKIYHIMQERDYKAYLLGAGSRAPHHFTELVGGHLAMTISISHARPLVELNLPVVSRIDAEPPTDILHELVNNFLDFRQAYYEDGLTPTDFRKFGPCVKFQKACEEGYLVTLEEIKARRLALLRS